MAGRTKVAWAAELVEGAARFTNWRRRREAGTRIPAALWELAVELARRHGVSRTSQALRVGYYSLQERVAASVSTSVVPTAGAAMVTPTKSPAFVELTPAPFAAACECAIEFEKPCGAKLRVQVRGPQLPDLAALGRAFWESR